MRIELFNCPIDAISFDETLKKIETAIHEKKQIHHGVVNVAKLVNMQSDEQLFDSVANCDLINADGQGVIWAAKLLGKNIPERVSGIDLMEKLVEISATNKYRVFFFGAEESIVSKVVKDYKQKHGIEIIAGYNNGYYSINEEEAIANKIAASNANILFVAMGSPKKEFFLNKYKKVLNSVNLIMGVGGSFDVIAGKVKRAPVWMQKSGLEWFYRFLQEPTRLFKRYFTTNLQMIGLILRYKFKSKN